MDPTVQSTATLLKAGFFAALLAVVVLVIAILPAEYGIDPTGLGEAMGLVSLASATDPVEKTQIAQKLTFLKNTIDITIPAGMGLEYKSYVVKGYTIRYA